MYKFSPEFKSFGPEVLDACIDQGATKVAGFLTPQSIERVTQKGGTCNLDILLSRAPEVAEVTNYILSENSYHETMIVNCSSNTHTARGADDREYGHVDGGIASCGFSLLLPISGSPAFFGAGGNDFVLFGDEDDSPELFWEYGVGDAIFLRQALYKINGELVEKEQVIHCGMSGSERTLQIVDYIAPDINISKVLYNFPRFTR